MTKVEQRTTSIGLCLQAQSYLDSAKYLLQAKEAGNLSLRFNDPIDFLLAHGIELTLKAWLRTKEYRFPKLIKIGHNLTELYKECKRLGLPIDEKVLVGQWTAQDPIPQFSDAGDSIAESERVAMISPTRRDREVWRHLWLLGKLHNAPFVLRYQQSGYYKYPDVAFLLMSALDLNAKIHPACQAHYNASRGSG
jgi:hypothetical protein